MNLLGNQKRRNKIVIDKTEELHGWKIDPLGLYSTHL